MLISISSAPDLCILMLWFNGQSSGIFLCSFHAHQLHFSLREAEYEAREQLCDRQSVGQGQTHQT